MNKLTDEKCRGLLEEIKYNRENCFLSEKTKMLMDIAESVILEQQERGEGKWKEWHGGECPVGNLFSDTALVIQVKLRAGNTQRSARADFYSWQHCERPTDIIAYHIIPEQPTNQNGEQ